MADFDLDMDLDLFGDKEVKVQQEQVTDEAPAAKRSHRRQSAIYETSLQYEYRRAYGEVKLLELMKYEPLKEGHNYHILTGGEIDQISFLKIILNRYNLDHVIISTWVISSEDILKLQEWIEEGRIKKLDLYFGEIVKNQYKVEYSMIRYFYNHHPEVGRYALFKTHAKIIAACNKEEDFYVGIQSSANCNYNPRNEQACITCDKGLYEFYKEYYDGIKSFDKE